MAQMRMMGATIRAIARRFNLSRSRTWEIVAGCEIIGPPPRYEVELVRTPSGAISWRHGERINPGIRAYRVIHGRRVNP